MTPEQKKKANANNKKWSDKNKNKKALYKRKHYSENRDKYLNIERERSYKKLYGITISDYDRMFDEQKGQCAICEAQESKKGNRLQHFAVDHCHKTGKVRGLLCLACNHLLGRYEKHKDNIIKYLNK